jgi:hypothetical protein
MYILTICVHYTLYTCARFHVTEQLITENKISTLANAHQKQVLSQLGVNTVFCLTSTSGYINIEICGCFTRCGESYMIEKRGFNLGLAAVCFISAVTMNRILWLGSKLIKLVITLFFFLILYNFSLNTANTASWRRLNIINK